MKPLNIPKARSPSPFDALYAQLEKSFSARNLQQLKEAHHRKAPALLCGHHGAKSQCEMGGKESSVGSPGRGASFDTESKPSRLSLLMQRTSIAEHLGNTVESRFVKNPKAKVQ